MKEEQMIAAIDMGSNAIRLAIGKSGVDGQVELVRKFRVPVRLGAEAFSASKTFSQETIDQTVAALKMFKKEMGAYNVHSYRAFATSAFRDASNSKELAQAIEAGVGFHVEKMSGDKEAEVILDSVTSMYSLAEHKDYLLFDLGGGSLELSKIEEGKISGSCSFDLGTVRLMNFMDDVNQNEIKVNERLMHVQNEVMSFADKKILNSNNLNIIGTGGNFRRILKVRNMIYAKEKDYIKVNELLYIKKVLEGLTYEQRMEDFNLRADRADVIVPALKIICSIIEVLPVRKIYAPSVGLVNGILNLIARA